MRTKVQDRRLKKLIAFLKELPRKKFDFSKEVSESKSNGNTCATVGCAIGWTPKVFPKIVRWEFHESISQEGVMLFYGFVLAGDILRNYKDVALYLFGVPFEHDIFHPQSQHEAGVSECGDDATPKQVARMLEEYRKKYPAK